MISNISFLCTCTGIAFQWQLHKLLAWMIHEKTIYVFGKSVSWDGRVIWTFVVWLEPLADHHVATMLNTTIWHRLVAWRSGLFWCTSVPCSSNRVHDSRYESACWYTLRKSFYSGYRMQSFRDHKSFTFDSYYLMLKWMYLQGLRT
jgi:hypothetical protein